MIWSWMSFGVGYILGGISGILVLGIFIAGSKGETEPGVAVPRESKTHNSVVRLDSAQNGRKAAPSSRQPPDQSA